jgi:MFS family permease
VRHVPRRSNSTLLSRWRISWWSSSGFTRLWVAESTAFLAMQIAIFVLPLVAALTLNASPAQLGILGAAFFVPFFVLGLVAGAGADRWDRRRILLGAEVLSTLCVLAVPVASTTGRLAIELLYLVNFLLGVATAYFDAAAFAILPALVGRSNLVEANQRLQLSLSTARVMGPGLGGVMVEWWTAPLALGFSGILFMACGVLLLFVTLSAEQLGTSHHTAIGAEIVEGLRFVAANPQIRAVAAYTATSAGFGAAALSIFPLYSTQLGLSPSELGFVLAVGGIGGVLGIGISLALSRRVGAGPIVLGSAVAIAASHWLLPLAGSLVEWALPLLVMSRLASGAAVVTSIVHGRAIQQALTPDALQGRMFTTARLLITGCAALGAFAGGLIGQIAGLQPAMFIAAAGVSLSLWWLIFPPVWTTRLRHPLAD